MSDRLYQPRHCGVSHQSLVDAAYRRGYDDGVTAAQNMPLLVLQNLQADTTQEAEHAPDNGGQHLYRTQLIAQPGSEARKHGGANNRHENLGPKS